MPRKSIIAGALAIAVAPAGVAVAQGGETEVTARLNSRAEVPRTTSPATGRAELYIAGNQRSIRYELRASNLTGPPMAAHVHLGRRGVAGPVMIAIATSQFRLPREGRLTARQFTPVGNVRTFRQAIRAIRAGRTYVNIHTARFPAGEIRGQLRANG
jgi:hypothetical protein